MSLLPRRAGIVAFLSFAFAYFLSALLRAVTATLAPTLAQEFTLHAIDLGLLAGGYGLAFAAMQISLGNWLDRHGPKKVLLGFWGWPCSAVWCFRLPRGSRACWPGGCLAGRASVPA